jgi:UDP:flavonoid glycosyltransferase YjiC (YdhE family)
MGLGHATRSLGILKELLKRGHRVTVVSSGGSLQLLKKELDDSTGCQFIDFPDYRINYSRTLPAYLITLMQGHQLLKGIKREKAFLKHILEKDIFHAIISDHRYGFFSPTLPSFFITHQIILKPPTESRFFMKASYRLHKKLLYPFHRILIPDFRDRDNLSGLLSHYLPDRDLRLLYAGPLISVESATQLPSKKKKILIIISGPEPQRSVLEKKILEMIPGFTIPTTIVLGKPGEYSMHKEGSCIILNHLPRKDLQREMAEAQLVISRSGYTTLMEIAALRKASILIPTPGQTEQEYLARYWESNGWAFTLSQKELSSLPEIIRKALAHPRIPPFHFDPEKIIVNLVDNIESLIKTGVHHT